MFSNEYQKYLSENNNSNSNNLNNPNSDNELPVIQERESIVKQNILYSFENDINLIY